MSTENRFDVHSDAVPFYYFCSNQTNLKPQCNKLKRNPTFEIEAGIAGEHTHTQRHPAAITYTTIPDGDNRERAPSRCLSITREKSDR